LWDWRRKCGVTPSFGAVRDGVDESRPKAPGKLVFASTNFTQEIQHVALPHRMRALHSAMWESTLELPYYERQALSDHDGEGQQVPVIVSTNYRRLAERIAA